MGAICGTAQQLPLDNNDQQNDHQNTVDSINAINNISSQVERLATLLANAQKQADTNRDGVVTREEMESYLATQLQIREEELLKTRSELEKTRAAYLQLEQKINQTSLKQLNKPSVNAQDEHLLLKSHIDDAAIEKFVQSMIDDPNINMHGVPDIIEKAMYRRAAKMTLSSLGKIFENIALELMGHKIHVVMQPTVI